MKREIACLLALCAFTAAMVPRERRDAENAENANPEPRGERRICIAELTSCRWALSYESRDDKIVDNTYCECAPGHQCVLYASDQDTHEYRCKKQP